jgi:hypothetical protein
LKIKIQSLSLDQFEYLILRLLEAEGLRQSQQKSVGGQRTVDFELLDENDKKVVVEVKLNQIKQFTANYTRNVISQLKRGANSLGAERLVFVTSSLVPATALNEFRENGIEVKDLVWLLQTLDKHSDLREELEKIFGISLAETGGASTVVDIQEYQEEIVLHFGGDRKKINAYTLASSLVSLADAIKEANSIVNPGYEVEVLVEAFGEGSFRTIIKTTYASTKNLFSADNLKTLALGILATFIYEHAIAPDSNVEIKVDDNQVIVQQGEKTIIIPRTVYDAQKEVQKSDKFRDSVSKAFRAIEKDKHVTNFGLTKKIDDEEPDLKVLQSRFSLLSSPIEIDEPQREIQEIADLQIKRAILERSKRKWEFIWRGIKISAPVIDDGFYKDFFAHKITVAPGDSLEAILKIYQSKDEETGIYTNSKYEVIEVRKHVPRFSQSEIDA